MSEARESLSPAERLSKEFWYVGDRSVTFVTGYICEGNPDYWWCPEVGYSAQFGSSLFFVREQAVAKLVERLWIERHRIDQALAVNGEDPTRPTL